MDPAGCRAGRIASFSGPAGEDLQPTLEVVRHGATRVDRQCPLGVVEATRIIPKTACRERSKRVRVGIIRIEFESLLRLVP